MKNLIYLISLICLLSLSGCSNNPDSLLEDALQPVSGEVVDNTISTDQVNLAAIESGSLIDTGIYNTGSDLSGLVQSGVQKLETGSNLTGTTTTQTGNSIKVK